MITHTCTYCAAHCAMSPTRPFCPGCGIDALQPGDLTQEEVELAHLAGFGPASLLREAVTEAGVPVHGMTTLLWPRGVRLAVGPEGDLEIEAEAAHDAEPRWRVRVVAEPAEPWHPAAHGDDVTAWVVAALAARDGREVDAQAR